MTPPITCLRVLSAGLGSALVLIGLFLPNAPPDATDGPAVSATTVTPTPIPGGVSAHISHAAGAPTHVDIPRIGVHADVISLGLNADGTVMVPPSNSGGSVGWYRYLATPGESGPAVLLGHVDSYRGPAVFYRLSTLVPGDRISIARADGATIVFTVRLVQTYPKSAFPAEAVYGPTPAPVLRLITCGGRFDYVHRTYLSNVVVYAELAP